MRTLRDFGIKWVSIEITNICNMHCSFCPSDIIRRPRMFMDFDLFKHTIDQIALLRPSHPILLHLLGEPLLHKDLFQFIDYLSSKNISVYLFTNGVALFEKIAEICSRKNIETMAISLQTPTPETYKMRGSTKPFNKYIEDIYKSLDYYIRSNSKMDVEIYLAETKSLPYRDWDILTDPIEALHIIKDYCRKIPHADKSFNDIPIGFVDEPYPCYPIVLEGHVIYIRIRHLGTWGNLFPSNALLKDNKKEDNKEDLQIACQQVNDLVILADGTISICCLDFEGELSLGNVREVTIIDALMSDKRMKMIDNVKESELCRRCLGIT